MPAKITDYTVVWLYKECFYYALPEKLQLAQIGSDNRAFLKNRGVVPLAFPVSPPLA